MKHKNKPIECGFTLIELMVVVVIVAVFAAIAIPSYQSYVRHTQFSQAQQEMQRLANELEKWKSRNFNYLGFNVAVSTTIPTYSIIIRDGDDFSKKLTDTSVNGQSWIIQAVNSDGLNFSLVMTSAGVQCKNKTKANITIIKANDTKCGVGGESW
ncbi:type IV pilin protein [Acinetobacter gyllenbergii]|uniref:type IV pilin protein n=1 Tax=Acinetobacter gyllenbergii TaxID=134534 RepID=UPI00241ED58E|nr:type IV pilin protein [Acinetobacter gyllenbergii]